MPRILATLILFATFAMPTGGAAAAGDYPFCLRGCDFGTGDCSFYSYRQCQATASGRDAWCDANPAFHQSREPQAVRYSRRKF